MDLTRLYNLTTPELRAEAERLGVNDTYAMSRGQLIHAIRNQVGGAPQEGFLGKVLGFAKWALQPRTEAQESDEKKSAAPVPMPSMGSAQEPVATAEPVSAPEPAAAAEPAAASARKEDASHPPRGSGVSDSPMATESLHGEPAAASGTFGSPSDRANENAVESGPPSRPPVGVFSQSASLFDEPFPTLTMARILADQGHFKRSLAIYARLLEEAPANSELRSEADEVRTLSRARRPQVH